jgi:predicted nucleic-acid-binding Zn-ribbon protein
MKCPVCGGSHAKMETILYKNICLKRMELVDFEIPDFPVIMCYDCGEVSIPGESEVLIDEAVEKILSSKK